MCSPKKLPDARFCRGKTLKANLEQVQEELHEAKDACLKNDGVVEQLERELKSAELIVWVEDGQERRLAKVTKINHGLRDAFVRHVRTQGMKVLEEFLEQTQEQYEDRFQVRGPASLQTNLSHARAWNPPPGLRVPQTEAAL